ncbi:MAG TPA: sialidase family protein [Gemmatimonadaceae bacterium]|nr:sialidase family protein [Gemmatimonadaceae bacterium]
MRTLGAPRAGWRLTLDAHAKPVLATQPTTSFVAPAGACAGSMVFAPAGGSDWFVAWWQPRADSSAQLLVSQSIDAGASWSAPVAADDRDHQPLGCGRPNAAIVADSPSGYVHLAYFLAPSQGAGVWYVHSQDKGATWHAPVGVFYGDDPARADVAAHGDTVLVAYEYPNADDARVGVALSYTAGHTFLARMAVSPNTERASDPRVAIGRGVAAVGWASGSPNANGRAGSDFTVVDVARVGRRGD